VKIHINIINKFLSLILYNVQILDAHRVGLIGHVVMLSFLETVLVIFSTPGSFVVAFVAGRGVF
jgi:hypothetical protein